MQKWTIRHWLIIAVFNLLVVAVLGLFMRLKTIFPLPWANQTYLLHAHSHFAFAGWVSHALMVFMVMAIFRLHTRDCLPVRYQYIVAANLWVSLGMLVSFALQGYGLYAIIFSSLTLLLSFVFAGYGWRDIGRSAIPELLKYWFRAALFFSLLSSLGTFSLVRLMVTKQEDALKQLASVYFYLHFQYNGWFLFACIGLFIYWLYENTGAVTCSKKLFWLFFSSVIPAYFLSVLWWKDFSSWLYPLVAATVIVQLGAWALFVRDVFAVFQKQSLRMNPTVKVVWTGVAVAVFIKFLLQAVSALPSLSRLAYSYRPIMIAYLHLVLLVIVSLFILGFAFEVQGLRFGKSVRRWLIVLVVGILLNELVLMMQGIGSLARTYIPATPHFLVLAAGIIVVSLCGIFYGQRSNL